MAPNDKSKTVVLGPTGGGRILNPPPKRKESNKEEGSTIKAGAKLLNYTAHPATHQDAQIQGFAMARSILNDPKNEIFKNIAYCPHTTGQRCRMVRTMITDEKAGTDVVFVIATWCMLGGNIPRTWVEGANDHRPGKKRSRTDWGEKIITELDHLGRHPNFFFNLCRPYSTGLFPVESYDFNAALWDWNKGLQRHEKESTTKHAADFSPDNSDQAKRRKTDTPSGQTQQQTGFQTPNESQLKDVSKQSEGATTNQACDPGTPDGLLAKLSREQLEVMIRHLKSKVDMLERKSALRLELFEEWSTRATTLQEIVDEAANHGADTLGLVQANIDLRKKNDDQEQMITVNEIQARHLKDEIASFKQTLLDLGDERETLEGRVSNLREEAETLDGKIKAQKAELHDRETLSEENTKLQADLEASKQETSRLKRWLSNIEVETTTRIPGINVVRKSTVTLEGFPESVENETRVASVGSNGAKSRKHDKS